MPADIQEQLMDDNNSSVSQEQLAGLQDFVEQSEIAKESFDSLGVSFEEFSKLSLDKQTKHLNNFAKNINSIGATLGELDKTALATQKILSFSKGDLKFNWTPGLKKEIDSVREFQKTLESLDKTKVSDQKFAKIKNLIPLTSTKILAENLSKIKKELAYISKIPSFEKKQSRTKIQKHDRLDSRQKSRGSSTQKPQKVKRDKNGNVTKIDKQRIVNIGGSKSIKNKTKTRKTAKKDVAIQNVEPKNTDKGFLNGLFKKIKIPKILKPLDVNKIKRTKNIEHSENIKKFKDNPNLPSKTKKIESIENIQKTESQIKYAKSKEQNQKKDIAKAIAITKEKKIKNKKHQDEINKLIFLQSNDMVGANKIKKIPQKIAKSIHNKNHKNEINGLVRKQSKKVDVNKLKNSYNHHKRENEFYDGKKDIANSRRNSKFNNKKTVEQVKNSDKEAYDFLSKDIKTKGINERKGINHNGYDEKSSNESLEKEKKELEGLGKDFRIDGLDIVGIEHFQKKIKALFRTKDLEMYERELDTINELFNTGISGAGIKGFDAIEDIEEIKKALKEVENVTNSIYNLTDKIGFDKIPVEELANKISSQKQSASENLENVENEKKTELKKIEDSEHQTNNKIIDTKGQKEKAQSILDSKDANEELLKVAKDIYMGLHNDPNKEKRGVLDQIDYLSNNEIKGDSEKILGKLNSQLDRIISQEVEQTKIAQQNFLAGNVGPESEDFKERYDQAVAATQPGAAEKFVENSLQPEIINVNNPINGYKDVIEKHEITTLPKPQIKRNNQSNKKNATDEEKEQFLKEKKVLNKDYGAERTKFGDNEKLEIENGFIDQKNILIDEHNKKIDVLEKINIDELKEGIEKLEIQKKEKLEEILLVAKEKADKEIQAAEDILKDVDSSEEQKKLAQTAIDSKGRYKIHVNQAKDKAGFGAIDEQITQNKSTIAGVGDLGLAPYKSGKISEYNREFRTEEIKIDDKKDLAIQENEKLQQTDITNSQTLQNDNFESFENKIKVILEKKSLKEVQAGLDELQDYVSNGDKNIDLIENTNEIENAHSNLLSLIKEVDKEAKQLTFRDGFESFKELLELSAPAKKMYDDINKKVKALTTQLYKSKELDHSDDITNDLNRQIKQLENTKASLLGNLEDTSFAKSFVYNEDETPKQNIEEARKKQGINKKEKTINPKFTSTSTMIEGQEKTTQLQGLLNAQMDKGSGVINNYNKIMQGTPAGLFAVGVGLFEVTKKVDSFTNSVSGTILKFVDFRKQLQLAAGQTGTVLPGGVEQMMELRDGFKLSTEETVKLTDSIKNLRTSTADVDTLTTAMEGMKDTIGEVDVSKIAQLVDLYEKIPKEQIEMAVHGTGSMDDQMNALLSLSDTGNLKNVLELQASGAFGEVAAEVAGTNLSEADKATIENQRATQKLSEDFSMWASNFAPSWFPFVGMTAGIAASSVSAVGSALMGYGATKQVYQNITSQIKKDHSNTNRIVKAIKADSKDSFFKDKDKKQGGGFAGAAGTIMKAAGVVGAVATVATAGVKLIQKVQNTSNSDIAKQSQEGWMDRLLSPLDTIATRIKTWGLSEEDKFEIQNMVEMDKQVIKSKNSLKDFVEKNKDYIKGQSKSNEALISLNAAIKRVESGVVSSLAKFQQKIAKLEITNIGSLGGSTEGFVNILRNGTQSIKDEFEKDSDVYLKRRDMIYASSGMDAAARKIALDKLHIAELEAVSSFHQKLMKMAQEFTKIPDVIKRDTLSSIDSSMNDFLSKNGVMSGIKQRGQIQEHYKNAQLNMNDLGKTFLDAANNSFSGFIGDKEKAENLSKDIKKDQGFLNLKQDEKDDKGIIKKSFLTKEIKGAKKEFSETESFKKIEKLNSISGKKDYASLIETSSILKQTGVVGVNDVLEGANKAATLVDVTRDNFNSLTKQLKSQEKEKEKQLKNGGNTGNYKKYNIADKAVRKTKKAIKTTRDELSARKKSQNTANENVYRQFQDFKQEALIKNKNTKEHKGRTAYINKLTDIESKKDKLKGTANYENKMAQSTEKFQAELLKSTQKQLDKLNAIVDMSKNDASVQMLQRLIKVLEAKKFMAVGQGNGVENATETYETRIKSADKERELNDMGLEMIKGFKESKSSDVAAYTMEEYTGTDEEKTKISKIIEAYQKAQTEYAANPTGEGNEKAMLATSAALQTEIKKAKIKADETNWLGNKDKDSIKNSNRLTNSSIMIDQLSANKGNLNKVEDALLAEKATINATYIKAMEQFSNNLISASKTFKSELQGQLSSLAKTEMDLTGLDINLQAGDFTENTDKALDSFSSQKKQEMSKQKETVASLKEKASKFKDGSSQRINADNLVAKAEQALLKSRMALYEGTAEIINKQKDLLLKSIGWDEQDLDITKELMETIGAPFETILSLEAEGVEIAKRKLDVENAGYEQTLENLKKGSASEQDLEKARLSARKAEANVIKKQMGAQRNAMEKLLGGMMGHFSEIGAFVGTSSASKFGSGYTRNKDGTVMADGKTSNKHAEEQGIDGYRDRVNHVNTTNVNRDKVTPKRKSLNSGSKGDGQHSSAEVSRTSEQIKEKNKQTGLTANQTQNVDENGNVTKKEIVDTAMQIDKADININNADINIAGGSGSGGSSGNGGSGSSGNGGSSIVNSDLFNSLKKGLEMIADDIGDVGSTMFESAKGVFSDLLTKTTKNVNSTENLRKTDSVSTSKKVSEEAIKVTAPKITKTTGTKTAIAEELSLREKKDKEIKTKKEKQIEKKKEKKYQKEINNKHRSEFEKTQGYKDATTFKDGKFDGKEIERKLTVFSNAKDKIEQNQMEKEHGASFENKDNLKKGSSDYKKALSKHAKKEKQKKQNDNYEQQFLDSDSYNSKLSKKDYQKELTKFSKKQSEKESEKEIPQNTEVQKKALAAYNNTDSDTVTQHETAKKEEFDKKQSDIQKEIKKVEGKKTDEDIQAEIDLLEGSKADIKNLTNYNDMDQKLNNMDTDGKIADLEKTKTGYTQKDKENEITNIKDKASFSMLDETSRMLQEDNYENSDAGKKLKKEYEDKRIKNLQNHDEKNGKIDGVRQYGNDNQEISSSLVYKDSNGQEYEKNKIELDEQYKIDKKAGEKKFKADKKAREAKLTADKQFKSDSDALYDQGEGPGSAKTKLETKQKEEVDMMISAGASDADMETLKKEHIQQKIDDKTKFADDKKKKENDAKVADIKSKKDNADIVKYGDGLGKIDGEYTNEELAKAEANKNEMLGEFGKDSDIGKSEIALFEQKKKETTEEHIKTEKARPAKEAEEAKAAEEAKVKAVAEKAAAEKKKEEDKYENSDNYAFVKKFQAAQLEGYSNEGLDETKDAKKIANNNSMTKYLKGKHKKDLATRKEEWDPEAEKAKAAKNKELKDGAGKGLYERMTNGTADEKFSAKKEYEESIKQRQNVKQTRIDKQFATPAPKLRQAFSAEMGLPGDNSYGTDAQNNAENKQREEIEAQNKKIRAEQAKVAKEKAANNPIAMTPREVKYQQGLLKDSDEYTNNSKFASGQKTTLDPESKAMTRYVPPAKTLETQSGGSPVVQVEVSYKGQALGNLITAKAVESSGVITSKGNNSNKGSL